MIEVLVDEKKIKIPDFLSIGQYQKIQKNPIKYNDPTEVLSLFLGLDIDEIKDAPKSQVEFVQKYLMENVMNNQGGEFRETFFIDDVEYGFENDWKGMKWGMWVDMEVFSQTDKIYDNIHIIMSILYRPIKERKKDKYIITPYKSSETMERAELFKEKLSVDYWFGAATFFLLMSNQYIKNIKHSLETKIKIFKIVSPILNKLPKFLQPKLLRDFISN